MSVIDILPGTGRWLGEAETEGLAQLQRQAQPLHHRLRRRSPSPFRGGYSA